MADYTHDGVPQEVKKWNWGAFMFNIFWGIGNRSYLPLLCLVPIFNIAWIFVCGFKGNEWAWNNREADDLETFLAIQRTWNRAGFVSFIIGISLFAIQILFLLATSSLILFNS
ncbi:ribonuclease G [Fusibacter sp. JL298sf-3]